ncbi:MAG: FAD:protein FMN transferase [Coriobacteriia bacterium]
MEREALEDIPRKDCVRMAGPDEQGLYSCVFYAFNTLVTLKGYCEDAEALRHSIDMTAILDAGVRLCRRYEWLLSRTLRGSELWNLNHAEGMPVAISPETAHILREGIRYASMSGGFFDITMGSVTRLWDLAKGRVPSREEVEDALTHVGWRNIQLIKTGDRTSPYFARLLDPKTVVDVGGIAKGMIADSLCRLFSEHGFAGAFVNLGGNVAVFGGRYGGGAWRIGIQSPFKKSQIEGVISLRDGSVVTSGLYERCFEQDGVFYHHILDSRTGFPVETDVAGVSVIARRACEADGYSTILFTLGSDAALALVEETSGLEAVIVTRDGRLMASSGLAAPVGWRPAR